MSETIFKVENVGYSYPGGEAALRDIGFSVSTGESVAILGANASGKSTFFHLLDGLYFADYGRIEAFGTTLTEQAVETRHSHGSSAGKWVICSRTRTLSFSARPWRRNWRSARFSSGCRAGSREAR